MSRQTKTDSEFGLSAISVEGGLISPDKLTAIASTAPDAKAATSYECPKGVSLRDEIARYFRIAQAEWQSFARFDQADLQSTTDFVKNLLENGFGFCDLSGPQKHHDDGHVYNIALEAKGGRVPIVIAPTIDNQDAFKQAVTLFGDGAQGSISKRRPDALLQEWLNASEPALWGLVFAGDRLRLMRDNASFTRPAYIEADLGAIFRDEMFPDFSALWLTIHASRFGKQSAAVTDCALEHWREEGVKTGTIARDRLRDNVEEALLALGQGFLEANPNLLQKLDSGALSEQDWFEQLLRIVYRLIFLAVSESRELLHSPDALKADKILYRDGYGFAHMRKRSTRRSSRDPHHDAFEGTKIVFKGLESGQARLGLPPLGGLFAADLTPDLNTAQISNRYFLKAVFRLSFLMENKARVRINWRDMATEELGSVYEGLLEIVPTRTEQGRKFTFARGEEARGNTRKTTGSYYTPDSLVQALLDSALDPVLDKAQAKGGISGGADAILDLNIIDPACGSGHFLLGAARRMATRVATLRDNENPDFQHALRDVVRRCIHGVDRNPMAVELARVALWIEAVEPGKPLSFLEANIRCGDSLLGVFDLEVLREGIPDDAYKPLTGDDKPTARDLAKRNREEKKGQGVLDFSGGQSALPAPPPLEQKARDLRAMPENTLKQIAAKEQAFHELSANPDMWRWKVACDLYIAAFLLPKTSDEPQNPAQSTIPTTGPLWQQLVGGANLYGPMVAKAQDTAAAARAFHWPLEFPAAMGKGGFDVVLGNPPWERIKLQEKEFFAARHPQIATAPNKAARDRLIRALAEQPEGSGDRVLFSAFEAAKRQAEAISTFVRISENEGGRYALTGRGDVNTYALFAEHFLNLSEARGQAGIIVPTGIATDATTSPFFDDLVKKKRLKSLYSFKEIRAIFLATDDRNPFCMLTLGRNEGNAKFAFSLNDPAQLAEPERNFTLSPETIARLNPNTKTAPVFRSRADAELTAKIYARAPVLIEEGKGPKGNPWGIKFARLFDMSNDSHLFRTAVQLQAEGFVCDGTNWKAPQGVSPPQSTMALTGGKDADHLDLSTGGPRPPERYVPLYEAKMIHQFDHRWAASGDDTYEDTELNDAKVEPNFHPSPRYWVASQTVEHRLKEHGWQSPWVIGWRDVTRSGDMRTLIAGMIPAVGVNHKFQLVMPNAETAKVAALYASMCSMTVDYIARLKLSGSSFPYFVIRQLPILPPDFYTAPRLAFITPRVLELTYTSHSLAPFARDLGYDGPPFKWDEERRALLRAELDAFYARAYGLTRDELRYILNPADVKGEDYPSETFRVLKNKEEKKYGEYRTRRLVLEAFDKQTSSQFGDAPIEIQPAQPLSLPDLDNLSDGIWAWTTTDERDRIRTQLRAVLGILNGQTDARRVRLVVLSCLHPQLLNGFLEQGDRVDWQRLMGLQDVDDTGVTMFTPPIDAAWGDMHNELSASAVFDISDDGSQWSAGPSLNSSSLRIDDPAVARALFAWEHLQSVDMEVGITQLSAEIIPFIREGRVAA